MAEVLLTLEDVYALPEPSIQTYLQAKGWSSKNFLADRIAVIIYLANDDWLRPSDQALVQLEDFPTTTGLSDEELICRVQGIGEDVTPTFEITKITSFTSVLSSGGRQP